MVPFFSFLLEDNCRVINNLIYLLGSEKLSNIQYLTLFYNKMQSRIRFHIIYPRMNGENYSRRFRSR